MRTVVVETGRPNEIAPAICYNTGALRQRGRQLATVDALIATTALRYDRTLLTTDSDFGALPGLRVATWLP